MTSRRYCFTLNNPTLQECPTLENVEHARYICYQLEAGANGTPHLQGYIEFSRPVRLTQVKRSIPRAHLEVARGDHAANVRYCSKEPRLGETIVLGVPPQQGKRNDITEFISAVRRGSTEAELLDEHPSASARYPRLRHAIKIADKLRTPKPLLALKNWQIETLRILDSPPHPRKIHWIWDQTGNVGKTSLARHMMSLGDCFYCTGGKHVDILYAYGLESNIIFDFPRGYEEKVPYPVLESLKNGIVFSSKYESKTMFFDVPYIFVFANFKPDKTKLSADRWNISEIIEDGLNYIMTI